MKKSFSALAALALLCLVACGPSSGCAGRGTYNPISHTYDTNAPSSVLVVAVEKVRATALDTFDAFLQIERSNETALKALNPRIHDAAELIRRDGKNYLDSLSKAKVAFQTTRSDADATALKESLAAVQSLLSEALKYFVEATAAKKP